MKDFSKLLFCCILLLAGSFAQAQNYVTRTIKSFGAKGDGKTNDTKAFQAAADFFNKRGGNGKLIISSGTYRVGKTITNEEKDGTRNLFGTSIFPLANCRNVIIEGSKGSVIKYIAGLKLGSFDPASGKLTETNSRTQPNPALAMAIGYCISISACSNITLKGLTLNGNNKEIIFGGTYGDVGIQLTHTGIGIVNSRVIKVESCNASYFGLDGIGVMNIPSPKSDSIFINNSSFEYNCRQGLSWTGGNFLVMNKSSFNHTGQGAKFSPPGAGFDIEAEVGPVRNGRFYNCSFINNKGVGMVADSGNSGDCIFTNCTFWGTENFALWTQKPAFIFRGCTIYGAVVHGYDSPTQADATKFIKCYFEDKPYRGKYPAYSTYLIDSDSKKAMVIDSCTFVANRLKLVWLTSVGATDAQKRVVTNNHFIVKGTNFPTGDFVILLRDGVKFKNNIIEFTDPAAKNKKYWPTSCCPGDMNDLGGNKVIYH